MHQRTFDAGRDGAASSGQACLRGPMIARSSPAIECISPAQACISGRLMPAGMVEAQACISGRFMLAGDGAAFSGQACLRGRMIARSSPAIECIIPDQACISGRLMPAGNGAASSGQACLRGRMIARSSPAIECIIEARACISGRLIAGIGPSASAQAGEAGRLLGIDRARRGVAADDRGDLARGLERLMRDRRRHEAADVRRRHHVGQARELG
jgi:hypothetical protein